MNKRLVELMLRQFEPGKREHAFDEDGITYDSSSSAINRFANEEHGFVYVWDEELKQHVRIWVE